MPWKAMQGHGCSGATPWAVVKTDTGSKVSCHASKAKAQAQVNLLYAKEDQMSAASSDCGCDHDHAERAVDNSAWDGNAAMSACSDAACYRAVCAGRKAGPPGERGSWALPHHKRPGSPPNAAAARNALARLPQTQGLTNREQARRHLEAHMSSVSAGSNASEAAGEVRSFRFALERADGHGDDLTLEGYAAVFNSPTRVDSLWEGEFDEVIKRGAFTRTLAERAPKLMFEHGRHPLVGQMPLGVISEAREDAKGLFIRARLSDNWLIQPVRDAVRDGAVDGMSFRFSVPEGGDEWKDRKADVRLRTLLDIDVAELGPVVFPAYEPTTASVRSLVERLEDFTGRPDARSAGGGDPAAPTTPGHGEAAPTHLQRADHDALRLRGILR